MWAPHGDAKAVGVWRARSVRLFAGLEKIVNAPYAKSRRHVTVGERGCAHISCMAIIA